MKLLERIQVAWGIVTKWHMGVLTFTKPPAEGYTITVAGRVAEFTLPRSFHDWDIDYWTVNAMKEQGGSFVKSLAVLFECGDLVNRTKIKRAWREYWDDYEERGQKMRYEACPSGLCDGFRELATDETDVDGNIERGVGTQKCPHGEEV